MMLTGAVALAGAGAFGGAAAVNAAAAGGTSLSAAIATKFGLKQADVQAVIDSQHEVKQAERQKTYEAKLDAAVSAGTISADQKIKIMAKVKELEASRQADRATAPDKTPAERQAAREAKRVSLNQWAADNKIPENLLMMKGFEGRMHGPMGAHMMDSEDTSASK